MFKLKQPGVKVLKSESSHPAFPTLKPIRSAMPEWYRKSLRQIDASSQGIRTPHPTIKGCVPVLDALTIGYYIPTPADIYVTQENGFPYYTWPDSKKEHVVIRHPDLTQKMPIPPGYANQHAVLESEIAIELPKGYSLLITHPLNRTDLPFLTLSGIIDDFTMYPGKLPFFMKEGFEGLIPQGTPFAQVIPFKREAWVMKETPGLYEESQLVSEKAHRVFYNWYRDNVWQKKDYK